MTADELCERIAPILSEFLESRRYGSGEIYTMTVEFENAPDIFSRHNVGPTNLYSLCSHILTILRATQEIRLRILPLD